MNTMAKRLKKNYISILFSEMKTGAALDTAMIVNLDQEAFQGTVSKNNGTQENQIIIYNSAGTIISHTDGSLINHNISDVHYIQTVLKSPEKQGRFTETYENKKILVTFVKPDKLGWIYIGVYDDKSLLNQVALLKNSIYRHHGHFPGDRNFGGQLFYEYHLCPDVPDVESNPQ